MVTKMSNSTSQRDRFLASWSGGRLLRDHSLSDYGEWKVYGEDPNCDMGGHHHTPYLGRFKGTLSEVIDKAVSLSGFFAWGAGGDIKQVTEEAVVSLSSDTTDIIPEIPSANEARELQAQTVLNYDTMCAVTDAINKAYTQQVVLMLDVKVLEGQEQLLRKILTQKGYTDINISQNDCELNIRFSM